MELMIASYLLNNTFCPWFNFAGFSDAILTHLETIHSYYDLTFNINDKSLMNAALKVIILLQFLLNHDRQHNLEGVELLLVHPLLQTFSL